MLPVWAASLCQLRLLTLLDSSFPLSISRHVDWKGEQGMNQGDLVVVV